MFQRRQRHLRGRELDEREDGEVPDLQQPSALQRGRLPDRRHRGLRLVPGRRLLKTSPFHFFPGNRQYRRWLRCWKLGPAWSSTVEGPAFWGLSRQRVASWGCLQRPYWSYVTAEILVEVIERVISLKAFMLSLFFSNARWARHVGSQRVMAPEIHF